MNYETHLRMPTIGSSASHFIKLTASGGTDEQNERAIVSIDASLEYLKKAAKILDRLLKQELVTPEEASLLRTEIAYRYGV